jgi:hypothetical protein
MRKRRLAGKPGPFWHACGILLLCLALPGILPATGQGQIRAENFSFEPRSIVLNPGDAEGIIIVDTGSLTFEFDKNGQIGIIVVDSGKTAPLSIKIIRGGKLVSADEVSVRVIPPDQDSSPKPGTFKIGLKAAKGLEASADYQLRFDIGRVAIPIPREAFELRIGKGR